MAPCRFRLSTEAFFVLPSRHCFSCDLESIFPEQRRRRWWVVIVQKEWSVISLALCSAMQLVKFDGSEICVWRLSHSFLAR